MSYLPRGVRVSLQVLVKPRILLLGKQRRVNRTLRVHGSEMDVAVVPRVKHAVTGALARKPLHTWHEKATLIGTEVVSKFMIAGCGHIRHSGRNRLHFIQEVIKMRHVTICVRDVSAVDHHVQPALVHEAGELRHSVIAERVIGHVCYNSDVQFLARSEGGEAVDLTPAGICHAPNLVVVRGSRLQVQHYGAVNHT